MSKSIEHALVDAVSACVHYQEFIDTGESFDLVAAKSAMRGHSLNDFIRHNGALIPIRRDGKSIMESIED